MLPTSLKKMFFCVCFFGFRPITALPFTDIMAENPALIINRESSLAHVLSATDWSNYSKRCQQWSLGTTAQRRHYPALMGLVRR